MGLRDRISTAKRNIELIKKFGFDKLPDHDKLMLAALIASESGAGGKKQKWSIRDIGVLFGLSAAEVARRKKDLCGNLEIKRLLARLRGHRQADTKRTAPRDLFKPVLNWRARATEKARPLLEGQRPKTPQQEAELQDLKDLAEKIVDSLDEGDVNEARRYAELFLEETR